MDATLIKDRIHICQELMASIDKSLATVLSTVCYGFLEEEDGEKHFTLQEHVVDFLDHSQVQELCLSVTVQAVLQKLTRICEVLDRTRIDIIVYHGDQNFSLMQSKLNALDETGNLFADVPTVLAQIFELLSQFEEAEERNLQVLIKQFYATTGQISIRLKEHIESIPILPFDLPPKAMNLQLHLKQIDQRIKETSI